MRNTEHWTPGTTMTEPASSSAAAASAAVGWSIKSGAAAGLAAVVVSIIAIVVGFTVVPLQRGREMRDAARRLAAGMLCSFIAGPALAFKAIDTFPWLLSSWMNVLNAHGAGSDRALWAYLAAGAPFIAVTGLLGFWVVAAVVLWFERRKGKDIGEMARDAVHWPPRRQ